MARQIRATIDYLQKCQAARAQGYQVAYTSDPAWLVTMAINRRAGWPDDPGFLRGSAMPVNGTYPKRASDQNWRDLQAFARKINTPHLAVLECESKHLPRKIVSRISPKRFTTEW